MLSLRKLERAFKKIIAERAKQERLREDGRFLYTCASSDLTNEAKFLILAEEVGELAGAIMAEKKHCSDRQDGLRDDVKKELLHVTAVAAAWMESFED